MAGEGDCPICVRGGPADTIVALDASWVTAPRRAALPGYLCVVARTHVDEPFDLDGLERRRYWEEMLLVARAVRDTTGAAKMNYEIHGNTIPHLHTHGTIASRASRRSSRSGPDPPLAPPEAHAPSPRRMPAL